MSLAAPVLAADPISLSVGGLVVAFAAGFVSFVSPCVLPLVPGYLSFVSGVGFDELGARTRRVVLSTAGFVLGFTIMFVLLGFGAAWFGNALLENRRTLEIVGGSFLILAAIVFAGLPLPRVLAQERRLHVNRDRTGPLVSIATGVVFAIAWQPCLGPTLSSILSLAGTFGQGGAPTDGAILLAFYSLGLGVPFLLFGLFFTRALGLVRVLKRHWRLISLISSALLVTFGILMITGEFTRLMNKLTSYTGLQI